MSKKIKKNVTEALNKGVLKDQEINIFNNIYRNDPEEIKEFSTLNIKIEDVYFIYLWKKWDAIKTLRYLRWLNTKTSKDMLNSGLIIGGFIGLIIGLILGSI